MDSNGTIIECRTLFEKLHLLSDGQLNTLLGTNLFIAIVNASVNMLVIWLIIATKQYTNTSLRLTMYMSVSDFFVGAISQQMLTYFIVNAKSDISCGMQVFCQYILYLFPHLTGFFVGMVALDRYCRVKYSHKYPDIMTFKRQSIGVAIITLLACANCMVLISGIFTGNWLLALLGIQPLDVTFVTMDIFLYWRSIVLMKEHMKANSVEMKHFSKSISKLATIYLVLVIIFYPPYLLLDMIQAFINSKDTAFIFWHIMSLIWVFLNSGIDAISFLFINRKARRQMDNWKAAILKRKKVHAEHAITDSQTAVDI